VGRVNSMGPTVPILFFFCDEFLEDWHALCNALTMHFRIVEYPTSTNPCEELWVKICFEDFYLFVCGLYLPHSAPDKFCQRRINSVEQISAESTLNDLTLVCGDFKLNSVAWICCENALCPSNVTTARK
jgi:hypothetical protein